MNNKYLLGLAVAVVLVVAAGVFLLGKSGNPNGTSNTNGNTQTPSNQTQTDQTKPVEDVNVTVTSSGFEPKTVTVKTGGRVIWTNKSGQTVTVNSDLHPTHLLYPFLNLGEFSDGSSVSVVFDKAGTFTYHNHLDASQTGTVIAQ
jgi:plastocyanin